MARPKPERSGRRISVWLPPESDDIAKQIDNMSGFVQMALKQASGIMTFDILQREKHVAPSPAPTQEQFDRFNRDNPPDPLTAKRLGKDKKWPNTQTSQSIPEILL